MVIFTLVYGLLDLNVVECYGSVLCVWWGSVG